MWERALLTASQPSSCDLPLVLLSVAVVEQQRSTHMPGAGVGGNTWLGLHLQCRLLISSRNRSAGTHLSTVAMWLNCIHTSSCRRCILGSAGEVTGSPAGVAIAPTCALSQAVVAKKASVCSGPSSHTILACVPLYQAWFPFTPSSQHLCMQVSHLHTACHA